MNYGIYLWNAWNLAMEIMEFMDFNDIKPYISGVHEPRQVQKCNEKIPLFQIMYLQGNLTHILLPYCLHPDDTNTRFRIRIQNF